jgi:hypothetical protein
MKNKKKRKKKKAKNTLKEALVKDKSKAPNCKVNSGKTSNCSKLEYKNIKNNKILE